MLSNTVQETSEYFSAKHPCKMGKAISLQAWTGPEGSRRLRLPDFKTIGI
jgi:hypothetical protein